MHSNEAAPYNRWDRTRKAINNLSLHKKYYNMKGSNTEQHKALMRIHVRRMVCLKQHLSHSAQAQSAYEHPVRKMMHLKQNTEIAIK